MRNVVTINKGRGRTFRAALTRVVSAGNALTSMLPFLRKSDLERKNAIEDIVSFHVANCQAACD